MTSRGVVVDSMYFLMIYELCVRLGVKSYLSYFVTVVVLIFQPPCLRTCELVSYRRREPGI